MSNRLIEESPYLVLPSLARDLGLNNAIFIQQIHFLLENDSKAQEHEGRKWIKRTIDDWEHMFPWLGRSTIERGISKLKERGLIKTTRDLNKHRSDRTLWYTIDYEEVDKVPRQNDVKDDVKMKSSTSRQNDALVNKRGKNNKRNETKNKSWMEDFLNPGQELR